MKIKDSTRLAQIKQIMIASDPRDDWDNVTEEQSDIWHTAIDELNEILGEDSDAYGDFMLVLDKVLDEK